jgi:hypothetical protein
VNTALRRLPAGFAALSAATTGSTARPATASATAATTGAPASAATTEASAATPAAAKTAVGFGTGFVHIQCTSVQGVTIESGNGLIRLAFIFHFDERETAGTSGFTICHDPGTVNLAVAFEEAADALFRCVEIQVAYEYVLHTSLLSI